MRCRKYIVRQHRYSTKLTKLMRHRSYVMFLICIINTCDICNITYVQTKISIEKINKFLYICKIGYFIFIVFALTDGIFACLLQPSWTAWKRTCGCDGCPTICRWRWSSGSTTSGLPKSAQMKKRPSVVFQVSLSLRTASNPGGSKLLLRSGALYCVAPDKGLWLPAQSAFPPNKKRPFSLFISCSCCLCEFL